MRKTNGGMSRAASAMSPASSSTRPDGISPRNFNVRCKFRSGVQETGSLSPRKGDTTPAIALQLSRGSPIPINVLTGLLSPLPTGRK
jgi:hypothetical protein